MIRFDRLNELLLSLTPTEFEELCYVLIKSMGFFNLEWMKGGRDKGRDIKAEREIIEPGGYRRIETWYFQCKRYSKGIHIDDISSSIEWCIVEKVPYLVILSNSYLAFDTKDFVKKKEEQTGLKIRQWTDKDFQDKLIDRPQILYSHFHGENVVNPDDVFKFTKSVRINIQAPPDIQKQINEEVAKLGNLNTVEKLIKLLDILDTKSVSNNIDANFRAVSYQNFANICYYVGAMADSLRFLDKSLRITPQNKNVFNIKSLIFERQKKYKEAIAACEESLKIDGKDKIALNMIAHNLHQIGRNRGALVYLEDAIKLDPEFILARDNKGRILDSNGNYIDALLCFLETLKIKPNSKTTLDAVANLFASITAYDGALRLIEKAIELDPSFDIAWNTKGHILSNKAHYLESPEEQASLNKDALGCFTKAVSLNPYNDMAWTNLGITRMNLNMLKEATDAIENALKLDSKSISALNDKAFLLGRIGKDDEALKILDEALKINKHANNNKRLYLTRAQILFKKGTKGASKKALKALEDSLNYDKKFIDALLLKGRILESLKIGDPEKCYKRVEEIGKDYEKTAISLSKKLESFGLLT